MLRINRAAWTDNSRALRWLSWALLIACSGRAARAEDVKPLRQAHAHNDYEHARPLLDALDQGFTSVEADIHLVEGELLVAHDAKDAKPERTLERLYLDPLRERVRQQGGSVYAEKSDFILLVDIKTAAEPTYAALSEKLASYPELCTRWTKDGCVAGPVTIVVSGNRPIETIAGQLPRQAAIDGRLADLDSESTAELMPIISDNWQNHFTWNGAGEMPVEERVKLQRLVARAHARQQKLRFWATPDLPAVWTELRTADVDFIGTDNLSALARYLRDHNPPQ